MAIAIGTYMQPLNTALQKLQSNSGAAGKLQGSLDNAASALDGHASKAHGDAGRLRAQWRGAKGTTFEGKAGAAPKELDSAAADAKRISTVIGDAVQTVTQARREVQQLKDEFAGKARAIAQAAGNDPGRQNAARALLEAESAKYARAAAKIVGSAKGALAGAGNAGGTSAQSAGPSSAGAIGSRTSGSSAGSGSGGSGGNYGGYSGGGGGTGTSTGKAELVPPPKNNYNNGKTGITLPSGKHVEAPNPRAAAAVRAALSRKGLPYVWGGTDPTKGMDCSGLTQWSYGQAGVRIPRTAHTQTVGKKVSINDIKPGDLMIWSGHVVMYIGDGKIVEEPHTGAVCHIDEMRTTNAGEPFLGVFRPSA